MSKSVIGLCESEMSVRVVLHVRPAVSGLSLSLIGSTRLMHQH